MRCGGRRRKEGITISSWFFFLFKATILGWDRKKKVARGILSIPLLFLLPPPPFYFKAKPFAAHLFHHFRLRYLLSPSNFIRFHDGIKFFSFSVDGSRLCSSFFPSANRTIENVPPTFFYLIILVWFANDNQVDRLRI